MIETYTYCGADGAITCQETVEVADPADPPIDLPALADLVASLTSAVDDLILNALGGL